MQRFLTTSGEAHSVLFPLHFHAPPNDIGDTLGAAIVAVVKQPDAQAKLRAIGFEPTGQGVSEFTAYHAAEVRRWVAFYAEVRLRK